MNVLLKNGMLLHFPEATNSLDEDGLLILKRGRSAITEIRKTELVCCWWDNEQCVITRIGEGKESA